MEEGIHPLISERFLLRSMTRAAQPIAHVHPEHIFHAPVSLFAQSAAAQTTDLHAAGVGSIQLPESPNGDHQRQRMCL